MTAIAFKPLPVPVNAQIAWWSTPAAYVFGTQLGALCIMIAPVAAVAGVEVPRPK